MENRNKEIFHIHRKENFDEIWKPENRITIDDKFNSVFYSQLQEFDRILIERYSDYDIDYVIAMMEEMLHKELVQEDYLEEFKKLQKQFKLLRRENALEEGRKLYNPTAPSRMHSIFLTFQDGVGYWANQVGNNNYQVFSMDILNGNMFISSDGYFPDQDLMYDIQVEKSEYYWQPKKKELTLNNEILFQGSVRIIK